MSLINLYLDHDRALISYDTLSSVMPGAPRLSEAIDQLLAGAVHMSKCAFLTHAHVALAHRGDAMLAISVFSGLQLSAARDFDAMAEAMPELLAHSFAQVTAFRKQQFEIEAFHGAELVLVGWSHALKRMQAVRWVRWPQDRGFAASPVGRALLLPDAEWSQPPTAPDTPEKMERIARDQVAYVRRNHAGLNCGGRLLLAEITRDSTTVRTIADLEAPC